MKSPAFRAVALFLLLFSLITWSGIVTTAAAALSQPQAADACCSPAGESGETDPFSCSSMECPCFSCLPFAPADSLILGLLTAPVSLLLPHLATIHSAEIIRAIDYPPELA